MILRICWNKWTKRWSRPSLIFNATGFRAQSGGIISCLRP
jgi:hypothetical protein